MSAQIADQGANGILEQIPQYISKGSLKDFLKESLEEPLKTPLKVSQNRIKKSYTFPEKQMNTKSLKQLFGEISAGNLAKTKNQNSRGIL